MEVLRRTAVSEFRLDEARTLEELGQAAGNSDVERTPSRLQELFFHPRRLLPHFPSVTCDDVSAARIRAGRTVNLPDVSRSAHVKVFSGQTELIAIATRIAGTLFHAKLVLCPERRSLA